MSKMKLLWIASLFIILHEGACDGVCIAPGRYPNNTRDDCRGYVMCLKGAISITHYNLVCPEHSIYSHIDSQCTNVTSYQCFPNHSCSQEGNYINYLGNNCDSYIACILDLNKTISARLIKCPEEMIFSVIEGACVNSSTHKCIQESPTIPEVSNSPEVSEAQPIDDTKKSFKNGVMYLNSVSLHTFFLSAVVLHKFN